MHNTTAIKALLLDYMMASLHRHYTKKIDQKPGQKPNQKTKPGVGLVLRWFFAQPSVRKKPGSKNQASLIYRNNYFSQFDSIEGTLMEIFALFNGSIGVECQIIDTNVIQCQITGVVHCTIY